MKILRKCLQATLALGAVAFLGACSETPTTVSPGAPSFHVIPPESPELELVSLCKVGPVGTYTFDATADRAVLWNSSTLNFDLTHATYTITVGASDYLTIGGQSVQGSCNVFNATLIIPGTTHDHIARTSGGTPPANVTVVETAMPVNVGFDQAVIYQRINATTTSSTTTTNSATGQLGGSTADYGANIVFYNEALAPSLSVTKTADNASVAAGSNIGFGITVNSNGPGTALGVTLTDALPTGSGISWSIDAQPAGNPCAIASGTLTCNFGDMASGASATVHIISPTTTASCAQYSNTASADADNLDPITSTASTTVTCPSLASGTATGVGYPWSATQGAPKNWFMYSPWTTTGSYRGISETTPPPAGIDLVAGKTSIAGRITGTRGATTSITITLNSAYTFTNVGDNVMINPMSCTTAQPYVQPGNFAVKATASSASNTVTVSGLPNTACYGVHVNVSWVP